MSSATPTVSYESGKVQARIVVALAGNPNVGKTTLFNALTGLKQKVANYPGVTVEKKVGRCDLGGSQGPEARSQKLECSIIDLPGTYSLASRSPDEHVARRVVLGQLEGTERPDVVVVVADASNLERNLYLVTQVLELGRPTVVALSMVDVAEGQGRGVDAGKLSAKLGVRVVAVQANKGKGIEELKRAIAAAAEGKGKVLELKLPELMEGHVGKLKVILVDEKLATEEQALFDAHLMLSMGEDEDVPDERRKHPRVKAAIHTALVECESAGIDPIGAEIEAHYAFIGSIVSEVMVEKGAGAAGGLKGNGSDKLDRVLTHKVWGMGIFVGLMALMFWSIFSLAQPIMDFLSKTLVGKFGDFVGKKMAEGPLNDLVKDGIIQGVGNVVVFVPQIALLFLFLAILEDSGYMSRAAFLMDRIMSKVGLHGKSFIPLLSAYACAVPAIMGTRVIENKRDRFATILILPLMSCSARLPVYSLFTAMFFATLGQKVAVMLSMYALGTVAAFGMAWLFKRTLLKGPAPAFILEMPPYRMPKWTTVLPTVGSRCWAFLKRAGTVIFAFSVIMWAATNYPKPAHYSKDYAAEKKPHEEARDEAGKGLSEDVKKLALSDDDDDKAKVPAELQAQAKTFADESGAADDLDNAQAQEVLKNSAAGRVGKVVAPVFYPLGFDWKASIGVMGAFFARETIVSTMGIVYSVGKDADEESKTLKSAMNDDTWESGKREGTKIWTPLTAVSMMVFVVFCMQCLSTLAIVKREMGSWKWPAFMFVYMTGLAYVASLVVYQGGMAMGWGK